MTRQIDPTNKQKRTIARAKSAANMELMATFAKILKRRGPARMLLTDLVGHYESTGGAVDPSQWQIDMEAFQSSVRSRKTNTADTPERNGGVHLVRRQTAMDSEVQEAMKFMRESDLADFAGEIQTARLAWRRHRELVEAEEFPEDLRKVFVAHEGFEVENVGLNDECLEEGYESRLRFTAEEHAAISMRYQARQAARPAAG